MICVLQVRVGDGGVTLGTARIIEIREIVISGFRSDVHDICVLVGYYAASSGNPLPTFRGNVSVPSPRAKKTLEDGTDTLSRNVGIELLVRAA